MWWPVESSRLEIEMIWWLLGSPCMHWITRTLTHFEPVRAEIEWSQHRPLLPTSHLEQEKNDEAKTLGKRPNLLVGIENLDLLLEDSPHHCHYHYRCPLHLSGPIHPLQGCKHVSLLFICLVRPRILFDTRNLFDAHLLNPGWHGGSQGIQAKGKLPTDPELRWTAQHWTLVRHPKMKGLNGWMIVIPDSRIGSVCVLSEHHMQAWSLLFHIHFVMCIFCRTDQ